VAVRLADRGIPSRRVEALAVNPRREFCERLGARWLAEHDYDWDGVVLPECVYGWPDTRSLHDS
jgi:hypothetical protein